MRFMIFVCASLSRLAATLLALALCVSLPVEAQIAFRSATSSSTLGPWFRAATSSSSSVAFVAAGAQVASETAGSITPAIPAGTQAGDFAVLIVAGQVRDNSVPAAPAGWTLRSSVRERVNVDDLVIATFYRVLAGGDANPAVTLPAGWVGSSEGMSGQIAVWRGVDAATPFDVADTTFIDSPNEHVFAPAITTVTAGAQVVSAVATSDDNDVGFNNAAGFSARMSGTSYDTTIGGDHSIALADEPQPTPGVATMVEWQQTTNQPDSWAGITFALRPTTANVVISLPAGTAQNDVMIASVGVQPSTATITAPAGWTLVRRIDNGVAPTNSLAVYRKVAGASEPASYTWSFGGATYPVVGIQSFANIDTTMPIDAENGVATPSSTTHATPSVTTTVANALIVTSHTYAASRSWTPPGGMTEAFDQASGASGATGQSIEGSYVVQAAAGATGTQTATAATTAAPGNAHILALRPAGSPPLTINKPAGTTADDVLIAAIGVSPSTATITPPAGWTLVRRIDNASGNGNSLAVYRLVAGGAEPASYTWTLGGFSHGVGGIQSFSGVDTVSPINVENGQATGSGVSHDTPSVTTTVAGAMLVTSHTFSSSATWTPPAAMAEAFDVASLVANNANGQSLEGNWVAQAAGGATGAKSATASGNADTGNAHILALKPLLTAPGGGFTAFETATVAAAITGVIKTKVAGSAFGLDVVAIDSGAQMNSFSDNVKLELLANTGSGYGADNCPTANSVLQTIASAAIAGGRSTVNFAAVVNAYRDVRVRITYPTTAPTVISCSTDSFAIRPNAFVNFSVTDNDAQTPGIARALNNTTFTGGAVLHKAGRNFTVRSDAVNAAGTPVITTNYGGAPTAILTACGGSAPCTPGFGTLTLTTTFTSGQLASNASYNEVGSFTMQLSDSAFASIDSADGSTLGERTIQSSAINVGRFVPDHFAVALNPPLFQTACSAGGFTYTGQTFDYLTVPVITVTAQDASNNPTAFYAGNWWRITNASATGKTYAAVTGALDTSGITGTDPVIASSGLGVGTLSFGSGTGLLFTRTAPADPFNANISLSINVIDADGIAASANPVVFGTGSGIPFSSGAAVRYGRVRLRTAVGSELVDLPVAMTAEYYAGAGTGFVVNTGDTCTTNVSLAFSGYTKNLSAGETCVRDGGSPGSSGAGCAAAAPGPQRFAEPPVLGDFNLRLAAPGAGNSGSVVINGTVPSWLRYDWNTTTPGDENPSGQATFGIFGGETRQIYTRELY